MDAMGITWWISWDNMNISWDIPRFNGMQNGCMPSSIRHLNTVHDMWVCPKMGCTPTENINCENEV